MLPELNRTQQKSWIMHRLSTLSFVGHCCIHAALGCPVAWSALWQALHGLPPQQSFSPP